jgi:hypothetical protein
MQVNQQFPSTSRRPGAGAVGNGLLVNGFGGLRPPYLTLSLSQFYGSPPKRRVETLKEAVSAGWPLVPHGRWKTMIFLAALRHDRIDAPWFATFLVSVRINSRGHRGRVGPPF